MREEEDDEKEDDPAPTGLQQTMSEKAERNEKSLTAIYRNGNYYANFVSAIILS